MCYKIMESQRRGKNVKGRVNTEIGSMLTADW